MQFQITHYRVEETKKAGVGQAVKTDESKLKKLKLKIKRGIQEDEYWQETSENRIINIGKLQEHLSHITRHMAFCPEALKLSIEGKDPVRVMKERLPHGLASVMRTGCLGCGKVLEWDSSPRLEMKDGQVFDVNLRAVWGEMTTGGGMHPMRERYACIGIPTLTNGKGVQIDPPKHDQFESTLHPRRKIAKMACFNKPNQLHCTYKPY